MYVYKVLCFSSIIVLLVKLEHVINLKLEHVINLSLFIISNLIIYTNFDVLKLIHGCEIRIIRLHSNFLYN